MSAFAEFVKQDIKSNGKEQASTFDGIKTDAGSKKIKKTSVIMFTKFLSNPAGQFCCRALFRLDPKFGSFFRLLISLN